MRDKDLWLDYISVNYDELISKILSDKKPIPVQEEIEDLGYAVVVNDNGDEIRNH